MRAILPLAVSMITIWTAATWADDKADCRDGKSADLKIKGCSALITADAKDAIAFYSRGAAYQTRGDLDKAIADYSQAIVLKPDYAAAYENRARAFVDKGDYTRAVADVTKAGELTPKMAAKTKATPLVTQTPTPQKAASKPVVPPKPPVEAEKQAPTVTTTNVAPKSGWPDWAARGSQDSTGN
jgi:tetratricopeptide (TPR) repeat protein